MLGSRRVTVKNLFPDFGPFGTSSFRPRNDDQQDYPPKVNKWRAMARSRIGIRYGVTRELTSSPSCSLICGYDPVLDCYGYSWKK